MKYLLILHYNGVVVKPQHEGVGVINYYPSDIRLLVTMISKSDCLNNSNLLPVLVYGFEVDSNKSDIINKLTCKL